MLQEQSRSPNHVVIVGSSSVDLPNLDELGGMPEGMHVELMLSDRPSSSIQRNVGLDYLASKGLLEPAGGFVAFFDDDFRPAANWLEGCEETLNEAPEVIGLTGWVIADGIIGPGLSEEEAASFLQGKRPPLAHWSDRPHLEPIDSVYGCNMAFRNPVVAQIRFDAALPLYAWQEDTDFTGRTRTFGPTVSSRLCRGVHLGVKTGRSSGVQVGYSQVANPLHIAKNGNMSWMRAIRFVARAFVANTVKSMLRNPYIDYPGRLKGNMIALIDLPLGRCLPGRILDL